MKKKLLTLVALGASVALLAGCGHNNTPEVMEEDAAVVVEDTTLLDMTEVDETAMTVEAPVVDSGLEGTAE